MSDAKDIDDVDSPERNVDTTKDDENEANIEPENDTDIEGDNKKTEDDESEDLGKIEEDSDPQGDSAESMDKEPKDEEEKQDDNETEEDSDEVQNDEPEDTGKIEENTDPVDDSDEDSDEEPENGEEKQDDNEAEEENEEIQDDEPEDTGGIEENTDPVDDPAEASDEESEKEEGEITGVQDGEPEDGNETEESNDKQAGSAEGIDKEPEDDRHATTEKVEDKNKLFKILKWTGIISLPLIATAILLFLKPAVINNLFNTTELQIHTPKTAAIQWTAEELEMINVVGQTVTETEKIWDTIFTKKGGIYKKPDFTIFTGRISSVCAEKQENELIIKQSSLGTFYCPDERRIYIDLSLHRDLKNRLDIPGDFAQGYIVAHEIGHHVQNLAGISAQIPAARLRLSTKEFDMVSQRLELQADCFAGIWARHTAEAQYNVRPEEFADALDAVSNYSRKRLKQKKENDIIPDPFTHGSPRLRLRWFTVGFDKGTFDACDTFTVMEL